jgi:hypothetical protein
MTRLAIAVLGACTLALAQAPSALAMIQIDKGIAGARISSTRAQVKAALGNPVKTRAGSNDFGRYVQYTYGGGIVVTFQGEDRVSSVVTSGLGDRTSNGIGVGTAEADVKLHIPGVKCETIAGSRSCHTGRFAAGRKVTDFRISAGKVVSVFVGQVLD